jgi:hypothetical protein
MADQPSLLLNTHTHTHTHPHSSRHMVGLALNSRNEVEGSKRTSSVDDVACTGGSGETLPMTAVPGIMLALS